MTNTNPAVPGPSERLDMIDQARAAAVEQNGYAYDPGAVPLDPASISLRVVPCTADGCVNGRQPLDPSDPEDKGRRGCCEGFGVQLEAPAGLEPLVLLLACQAAYEWAYDNRGMAGVPAESQLDSLVDGLMGALAARPPHRHGASVSTTWAGSAEEERELGTIPGPA